MANNNHDGQPTPVETIVLSSDRGESVLFSLSLHQQGVSITATQWALGCTRAEFIPFKDAPELVIELGSQCPFGDLRLDDKTARLLVSGLSYYDMPLYPNKDNLQR